MTTVQSAPAVYSGTLYGGFVGASIVANVKISGIVFFISLALKQTGSPPLDADFPDPEFFVSPSAVATAGTLTELLNETAGLASTNEFMRFKVWSFVPDVPADADICHISDAAGYTKVQGSDQLGTARNTDGSLLSTLQPMGWSTVEDQTGDSDFNTLITPIADWDGMADVGFPYQSRGASQALYFSAALGDGLFNTSAYEDGGTDDSPPAYHGGAFNGPGTANFLPSTAGKSSSFENLIHLHPLATTYTYIGAMMEVGFVLPIDDDAPITVDLRLVKVKESDPPYQVPA